MLGMLTSTRIGSLEINESPVHSQWNSKQSECSDDARDSRDAWDTLLIKLCAKGTRRLLGRLLWGQDTKARNEMILGMLEMQGMPQ